MWEVLSTVSSIEVMTLVSVWTIGAIGLRYFITGTAEINERIRHVDKELRKRGEEDE